MSSSPAKPIRSMSVLSLLSWGSNKSASSDTESGEKSPSQCSNETQTSPTNDNTSSLTSPMGAEADLFNTTCGSPDEDSFTDDRKDADTTPLTPRSLEEREKANKLKEEQGHLKELWTHFQNDFSSILDKSHTKSRINEPCTLDSNTSASLLNGSKHSTAADRSPTSQKNPPLSIPQVKATTNSNSATTPPTTNGGIFVSSSFFSYGRNANRSGRSNSRVVNKTKVPQEEIKADGKDHEEGTSLECVLEQKDERPYFEALNTILKKLFSQKLHQNELNFSIIFDDCIMLAKAIVILLTRHIQQTLATFYDHLDGKLDKLEQTLQKNDPAILKMLQFFYFKTFFEERLFQYEKFFLALHIISKSRGKDFLTSILDDAFVEKSLEYFAFLSLFSNRVPSKFFKEHRLDSVISKEDFDELLQESDISPILPDLGLENHRLLIAQELDHLKESLDNSFSQEQSRFDSEDRTETTQLTPIDESSFGSANELNLDDFKGHTPSSLEKFIDFTARSADSTNESSNIRSPDETEEVTIRENLSTQESDENPSEALKLIIRRKPIQYRREFVKLIGLFCEVIPSRDKIKRVELIPVYIQLLSFDQIRCGMVPLKLLIFQLLSVMIGENMDSSVSDMLVKRKTITNLIQILKPPTVQTRFSISLARSPLDYISGSFVIQTLVKILESNQHGNPLLMKAFQGAAGYKIIQDAIIDRQEKFESEDNFMLMALKASVQLIYVLDKFSAENQLVMKQFAKDDIQKQQLKNAAAFHIFSHTVLRADSIMLQQLALDEILYLIAEYGRDSPIVHQFHPVALYIKNLESLSDDIQDTILKIVEFMIAGIDIVPREEILALLQILEESTQLPITEKVLTLFTKILHLKTEFTSILRELGLINHLLKLFSSKFKNMKGSQVQELPVLELATDVLIELIRDSHNLQIFRDAGGIAIMQELVLLDHCRKYALKIFQTIIVNDSIQNQVDVSVLVELIQTSPWAKMSVKTSIFNGLARILKDNSSAKDSFADGGFVASMSVIINSQWRGGGEPTSKYEGENNNMETFTLQDQIIMFEALFNAITAALVNHEKNKQRFVQQVGKDAIVDGLNVTNIMKTSCAKDILQFVLDMATERLFHAVQDFSGGDHISNDLNIGMDPILYNPFAFEIFLSLLKEHSVYPNQDSVVLEIINNLCTQNTFNLEQLSSLRIVDYILSNHLPALRDGNHPLHRVCVSIVEKFACYKIHPTEWKMLLANSANACSETILQIMLKAAQNSIDMETPYLEFVENSQGTIMSLDEKTWPPAQGYSFMTWFNISSKIRVDPTINSKKQPCVASILSLRSDDGKSVVEICVSPEGQLLFNSSSKTKFVVFSGFTFEFDKWYHIVVTHSKYRMLYSSSSVSLYVNGKYIESQKINYPGSSVLGTNVRGQLGQHHGQPLLGYRVSFLLGPSLLYEEVLPTESIPYFYMIGSSYLGLFTSSNSLKYLDTSYTSRYISLFSQKTESLSDDESKRLANDLSTYRLKKMKLSYDKIIFSYNASQIRLLDLAPHSSRSLTNRKSARFILNSKNSNLRSKVMLQGVYVCKPRSFSSDILVIDGIKVVFALIEKADTSTQLLKILEILRYLMCDTPFVIQEVLRQGGLAILSSFLSKKIHLINEGIIDCLWNTVIIRVHSQTVISFKQFCKTVVFDNEFVKRLPTRMQIYLFQKLLSDLQDEKYSTFNITRIKSLGFMTHLIRYLMDSPPLESILIVVDILKLMLSMNPTMEDISVITNFLSWSLLPDTKPIAVPKDAIFQAQGSIPSKHSRYQKSSISISASILAGRNFLLKTLLELLLSEKISEQMMDLYAKFIDVQWFSLFLANSVHPSTIILLLPLWCALIEREKLDVTFHQFHSSMMNYSNQREVYRVLLALQMGGTKGFLVDTFRSNYEFEALLNRRWVTTNYQILPFILSLLKNASQLESRCTFPNVQYDDCLNSTGLVTLVKRYQAQMRWKLLRDFVSSKPFSSDSTTHDFTELFLSQDSLPSSDISSQHSLVIFVLQFLKEFYQNSEEFRSLLHKQDNLHNLISILFSNFSYQSMKLDPASLSKHTSPVVVIPSPQENRQTSSESDRLPYQHLFEGDISEKVFDILNTIILHHLNIPGKLIRILEEIIEEHPKMIPNEAVDAYKENVLVRFIQACTYNMEKVLSCSTTRSNLSSLSSFIVTYYANGIITSYDCVFHFLATLIHNVHLYEEHRLTSQKNLQLGTKDITSQQIFKNLNRLLVFLLKQENQEEGRIYSLLKSLVENDWLVSSLNPLNIEPSFFGSLTYAILPFIIATDSENIREYAVTCMKLIVASGKLFTDTGNTMPDDLRDGFSEILQNNSHDFIVWLLQHQTDVMNFFKSNFEESVHSLINSVLEEKRKKPGKSASLTSRKISFGRIEVRTDSTLLLRHESRQILQSLKEDHERKLQNQKEQTIISRNFATEQWKTLKMEIFHERAVWYQKDSPPPKKAIDFSDNPLRMRKKLIDLPTNYNVSDPAETIISTSSPKQSSNDDLSSQGTTTPTSKDNNVFDDDIAKKRPSVYLLGHVSRVEELLLSPNKKPHPIATPDEEDLMDLETDLQSVNMTHNETETGIISDTAMDDDELSSLDEEIFEDDMEEDFKIRKHLDSNETILHTYNCLRVNGLDGQKALFVLCVSAMYIIDNYNLSEDNEIVEVESQSGSTSDDSHPPHTPSITHSCIKIAFSNLRNIVKRRFLLVESAIEFFCKDGQSFLVVFEKSEMQKVYQFLPTQFRKLVNKKAATAMWQRGELSNFEYLMLLNTLAGRSYNDLTQYPVFPWVLQQYDKEELDLNNKNSYRDLSKPMGAISDERKNSFQERYETWEDTKIPKFHYGSHYSSAAIVLYYMIRLEPFTSQNIQLQGGRFDISDRLFFSIKETFKNATDDHNMSDVKELIPEFYYLPEFLVNRDNLDLGVRSNGNAVSNVELPLWCNNDIHEFIRLNRKALESDFVSENLHQWVDLIFGFKQKGVDAQKSVNVFYYLTYEGAVDIDTITDPVERRATIAQISSFGQTPKQLFTKPHPKRLARKTGLPLITDDPSHLTFSEVKNLPHPIGYIGINHRDQLIFLKQNSTPASIKGKKYFHWNDIDGSLKIFSLTAPNALSKSHEILKTSWDNLHNNHIFTVVKLTLDGECMITGDCRGLVSIWNIPSLKRLGKKVPTPQLKKRLCGHDERITCIDICENYAFIVSGSWDGTCIVWDLNRAKYLLTLRDLESNSPVACLDINHSSGDIVSCSANSIRLWTLNGELISRTDSGRSPISCVRLLYENEWSDNYYIATGHQNGEIRIWKVVYHGRELGKPALFSNGNEKKTQIHLFISYHAHSQAITSLYLSRDKKRLYSGDCRGHIFQWTRSAFSTPQYTQQPSPTISSTSSPEILSSDTLTSNTQPPLPSVDKATSRDVPLVDDESESSYIDHACSDNTDDEDESLRESDLDHSRE